MMSNLVQFYSDLRKASVDLGRVGSADDGAKPGLSESEPANALDAAATTAAAASPDDESDAQYGSPTVTASSPSLSIAVNG